MTDVSLDQSNGTIDLPTRPPLVLFIHIPRTAGTAMTCILNLNGLGQPPLNHTGRPRRAGVWNVFKGGGGVNLSVYDKLRNAELPHFRSYLEALGPSDVALARGHFPLGVREYILPLLTEGRELRYLTFLRDPVDRTLSHFFIVVDEHAGSPDPSRRKQVDLSPLPAQPTLEDAIAGGYLHDNLQTRMLSGIPEPFGEVTDETLEQAKQNLRDPRLVFGLTERFDESLVLIKRRFGLRCVLTYAYAWGGVDPPRPRGREIPSELVAAAQQANRYDIELHRYARELFDAESELSEPDFQAELAALRAARGSGPIQVEQAPPEGFDGPAWLWREHVAGRAALREARGSGPIHVDQPPPEGFDGPPELWRERVAGLAQAQRLEWQVGELRFSSGVLADKLQQDLEGYKSTSAKRIGRLEQQLGAMRAAARGKAKRQRTKATPESPRGGGKPRARVKGRDRGG